MSWKWATVNPTRVEKMPVYAQKGNGEGRDEETRVRSKKEKGRDQKKFKKLEGGGKGRTRGCCQ